MKMAHIKYTSFILLLFSLIYSSPSHSLNKTSDAYGHKPIVLAHRAGMGQWPSNSLKAIKESLNSQYQGIEIDVVLTKDHKLILAHEPWVDPILCTDHQGQALFKKHYIQDYTLTQLKSSFLCGGKTNPEHPKATLLAKPLGSLAEVFSLIENQPEFVVYIDLKIEKPYTLSAIQYGKALNQLIDEFHLKNPIYIETPNRIVFDNMPLFAEQNHYQVLSVPQFGVSEHYYLSGFREYLDLQFNRENWYRKIQNNHVDGIASVTEIIDDQIAKSLINLGIFSAIFTINTTEKLNEVCQWPIEIIITDYPRMGTCDENKK